MNYTVRCLKQIVVQYNTTKYIMESNIMESKMIPSIAQCLFLIVYNVDISNPQHI